ncbi:MAG: hypothetical protein J6T74_06170, partial [Clostridia bacterium]|nr:hypothetical protein [Clostridia bacterium]
MKSFIEILNEASVGGGNQYNASVKIVRFLEKRIGQEYIDYDGQNYTNSEGNFFGYLFVSKTDTSAIRINWEGNTFHSINFWQSWNYNVDPTLEIKTSKIAPGNSSFTRLLPDIADILTDNNKFEDKDEGVEKEDEPNVNESLLTETGKFEYNGEIYNGKPAVIKKMYEEGKSAEEIRDTVAVPITY